MLRVNPYELLMEIAVLFIFFCFCLVTNWIITTFALSIRMLLNESI